MLLDAKWRSTVRDLLVQVDFEPLLAACPPPEEVQGLHGHSHTLQHMIAFYQVCEKIIVHDPRVCAKWAITLITRFEPSVGMSATLQVSSSLPEPETGVKSMLSPKSITCRPTRSSRSSQQCCTDGLVQRLYQQ